MALTKIKSTGIAANAVTVATIADGSITGDKIAANAVTVATIADGSITGDKIAANTITLDKLDPNVVVQIASAGGRVTISNVIVTDSEFNSTGVPTIPATGGFLKLQGSGFDNANVFYSSGLSFSDQLAANTVSSSEVRLTVGPTTHSIPYNILLINQNGITATKLSAFTSFLVQNTHGWYGGGKDPGPSMSTVDRIDFASDTNTASVRGPLSSGRYNTGSTGNNNYGWFGGGILSPGPGAQSTVQRIDFAADTNTASVKGPLSIARQGLGATGNDDYGWFGGGNGNNYSRVDRIDFAADTGTASVRGPLSLARWGIGATGNDNFGWFGGGNPGPVSRVDRIDFAADTSTASARGPLSSARYNLAATGNDNYGWFGGGVTVSTVDRIDFAADTGTASVRGPLSLANYSLAAAGNDDYGWFGGGNFPLLSTVDRIDFAADTATATTRGPLSLARYRVSATSGIA